MGDPKTVIVDEAAESQADLVVIGSHNASAVMGFLLAAIARAGSRVCACSVKNRACEPRSRPLRILLAADGYGVLESGVRSVASRPCRPEPSFEF